MSKNLPNINLNIRGDISMPPEDGKMIYRYAPFLNLKRKVPLDGKDLEYFRLSAKNAQIDIDKPIDIDIERSYDDSVNLIVSDKINPLKIINSRFYLTSSDTYNIADRKGNLDTNIYTHENFKVEANLVKTVQTVIKLDFLGLSEGGRMPVGNYTFYFKLADSDGNESDFIAESGKVVCHIGNISQPKFIRGGQLNENSGKIVKFRLQNLDLAYNFINVYYTRTTGDSNQEMVSAHKLDHKYKIDGVNTDISITGFETSFDIGIEEINLRYSEYNSAQTVENCQNITFIGNVTNDYELFKRLEQYSLFITPELSTTMDIGNLSYEYRERFNQKGGHEYFNVDNIYYKLGYWDQEIYRMGIVYILNDYTLSPVFNIRGIDVLNETTEFNLPANFTKEVNYHENYIIENTNGVQNAKGVFRIDSDSEIFSANKPIKPIGIKFNFNSGIVDGQGLGPGLQDITKGFFFVRQKRIPTILAQALGASSTKHGHFPVLKINGRYTIESFLTPGTGGMVRQHFWDRPSGNVPTLGASLYPLSQNKVLNNVLLCPEADLRTEVYNSYFNSSEYTLVKSKYQVPSKISGNEIITPDFKTSYALKSHLYMEDLEKLPKYKMQDTKVGIKANLLLVEPGINLVKNGTSKFSSKSGDAATAFEHMDVEYGDYTNPVNKIDDKEYNKSSSKVRGIFNTYIGCDFNYIENSTYYNIHQKDYDIKNWRDYFQLRYSDSSAYFPITDRVTYQNLATKLQTPEEAAAGIPSKKSSVTAYRGDCYINTFTHRMNWNFIDPELPTSTNILDKYTWYKHVRINSKSSKAIKLDGMGVESLQYNKLMPLFTYKKGVYTSYEGDPEVSESGDSGYPPENMIPDGYLTPEDKGFGKYSERNGLFGYDKVNRPDVNAVGLGQWVTYKICSNVNLAMRDVELDNPSEEALHGSKRSFFPLQATDKKLKLPESRALNKGISKTVGDKYYFEIPDVPFIKTNFPTRIHYSNILQKSTFVNGNRIFLAKNFQDYTTEYGAIVKMVEWNGTLIVVMEHGVLQIPVNERALMKNESGENVYINTDTVLPINPMVLSNSFGTLWEDSIVKTPRFIYGLDTVGKKIWRTDGKQFEVISDLSVQKFLNDNIHLRETDRKETVGTHVIKTHYNEYKGDVMFSFKYEDTKWHLCWNELLNRWVTRYSWYPEFSENINNIFYTFANKEEYKDKQGILYKHGFAGTLEEEGVILPTKWYGKQEPFEFEFVVTPQPGVQKIYNNFEIISNKVEPNSFIYEIIGDGFDWYHLKDDIIEINKE